MLKRLKEKMRVYSPWIFHAHAGGCNNCDIEVAACFAPRFDVEFEKLALSPPLEEPVDLVLAQRIEVPEAHLASKINPLFIAKLESLDLVVVDKRFHLVLA